MRTRSGAALENDLEITSKLLNDYMQLAPNRASPPVSTPVSTP